MRYFAISMLVRGNQLINKQDTGDMPLFQWVLALNYREKIYVMYKNLKTQALACLENRNYHVYR